MSRLNKAAGFRLFDLIVTPLLWLHRVLTVRLLILGALVFGIYKADAWAWSTGRPIVRDMAMTYIADKLAGPALPLKVCDSRFATGREDCQVIYSYGRPMSYWGIITNSSYLFEKAVNIVGQFESDRIVGVAEIPSVVYARPLITAASTHLGGQTDCSTWVMVNDRYLTFDGWNDAREVQSTLTHELIHNQDGNFCGTPVPLPAQCEIVIEEGRQYFKCEGGDGEMMTWLQRRSVWVESHTQAATVEALAGQCNAGDKIGCKAFWDTVKSLSARSLEAELNDVGLRFLYDPFMNLMVRSRTETRQAGRSFRDYALDGRAGIAARQGIVLRYGYMPWVTYVLPGINYGIPLDTGNLGVRNVSGDRAYSIILGMPFDDTRIVMGPIVSAWLRLMTAGTKTIDVDTGGLLVN